MRGGAAAWGFQRVRSERGCIRSGGDAEPLRLGRMGGLHPRRRQAVPGPGQLPPGHHGTRRFGNTPRSSPDDLDDEHICYVQDVVVNPAYHRQGVGRSLVEHLMRRYSHCRFFLLSTDHESTPEGKRNHAFYRSLGFLSYEEKEMAGFGLPRNRPDLRNAAP
ncbi:GNAT family N-acetyltransferase [Streptomyces sp. NBC_01077]|uniref:GNAT family N-acetyltransferase n=1 Tax=Streptomyces sp. NBC_01077 TaxID=2903746 RepID=UPI00386919C9